MSSTNKVKFGIKGVYYAVATLADNGTATYGSPTALSGAVSLSLEHQGENAPFYADNIVYYVANASSGYTGDLELAKIPDSFKKDILGYAEDANGILYETTNADVVHFALIFEFAGDKHNTRHVLYNCTASRPAVASTTIGETAEPQTESITITATSIYNATLDNNIIKARCTPTESTQYSTWNSAVYQLTIST